MNIFHSLNESINYIEDNLFEEKIELDKICKILGTNLNSFKNIFSFLTGYTLNEYIKLRRLSECVKLLPNNKIIDIAVMCGYNSRTVFSRAFKNFHGFNPSEFNEKSKFNYVGKIVFNEEMFRYDKIKFQIKRCEAITLYGKAIECESYNEINKYCEQIKAEYPIFQLAECYYGLVYKNKNNKLKYFIALEMPYDENNKVIKLSASNFLSATLMSRSAKDISMLGQMINSKSLNCFPDIEIYRKDEVEVLYKI